ncbi:hypothetical protein [Tepidibacillus fermentans]|uniref:DUF3800 domain-containing protein n=1 Tax=Tepidibacillus fermentans TaxID=1281767 RepID=A0A4R3K7V4_9BACI|nr:hypothetical protein [Tepidibacillus fermentans]TCS78939.1 hypothetical protein EDD72_12418 [Tepidibacillus fermentans]
MISLFIDESGQFEKVDTVVIGGVMIKHNSSYQLDKLATKVKQKMVQLYGEDYFKKIHGEDRDLDLREDTVHQIINSSEFEQIVPFYTEKGRLSKKILSNINDDNTASMLYFNMLNSLVTTLTLYHPSLLKNEREIKIYLASRVALYSDSRKDFKNLHGEPSIGKKGDKIYHLNNETSLLMGLNYELNTFSYLHEGDSSPSNQLHISIEKITINYEKSSKFPYMDLMFLADIVCNYVRYRRIDNYKVPFHKKIAFAYDDINEQYKEIYRSYLRRDLPTFLLEWFRYLSAFNQSSFKEQYDSYLELLDIDSIADSKSLEKVIYLAESTIEEKDSSKRKLEQFLLDFIEERIKLLNPLKQFKYYDLRIRANNHLGVFEENEKYYQKALSISEKLGTWEILDQKRMVMNRFAVSCSNIFDFKRALSISEQLIESQLALHETLVTSNVFLFDKETMIERDIILGKYYSSKGQYLAFLQREDAYEYFHKAIYYLQDDPIDKAITVSYLIHFLAESPQTMQPKDQELINEYLNGDDFDSRINVFLEARDITKNGLPFQFYTFIKLYRYRLKSSINPYKLNQLAQKVASLSTQDLTHPWPLIFYNLGELIETNDRKLGIQLKRKAVKITENKDSKLTMQMIGKMFEIKVNQDESSISNFVEFVEKQGNQHLYDYFEIENLKNLSNIEEKIKRISSKFTFMYH